MRGQKETIEHLLCHSPALGDSISNLGEGESERSGPSGINTYIKDKWGQDSSCQRKELKI